MTKAEQAQRAESIAWLQKHVPAGSKVYGIVRTVARSGMSRTIDFYAFPGDGERLYLSGYFADVMGIRRNREGALKVSGCGMDMIFGTIYQASSVVWRGTKVREVSKRNGVGPLRVDQGGDAGYVWRSESL
jgi:hypothetical protein